MLTRLMRSIAQLFRPRSFVGLDIGTTCVRVTRFRRGLTGHDEIVSLQRDVGNGDAPESSAEVVAERVRALLQHPSCLGVPVVAAIPTHWLFSRILTVPFTDPKRVAQVIPYETEELIPLGLDEVVFDHTILDVNEGVSTVLVAAVPRERMTTHLEWLTQAGVDPVAMDLDSLALFHFYRYALMSLAQDIVLIDIGASKTTMCVVSGGKLRAIRSVMIAGDTLTRSVAIRLGLTPAAAEAEKRHMVLPAQEDGFDVNDPASNALYEFLEPLTIELRNTIQAQEIATGGTITHLYLCGGGARLQGLPAYLARRLNLEIVNSVGGRFAAAQHKGASWDGDGASSLGLAVRPGLWGHGVSIDLRHAASPIPDRKRSIRRAGWFRLALGAAIVCGIGFADVYVDYAIKERRLQTLKETLNQDFRATFSEITTVVDPVQQARMALNQAQQRLAVFGHNSPAAILFILAEVTEHVPPDRTLEVGELTIEGAQITLEASTDSFESVETIKAALTKSGRLRNVAVSDARMGSRPDQVKFRVTAEAIAQ